MEDAAEAAVAEALVVMLDRLVAGLATTAPIQETLHVTRYPSSIWVLVLMQAFLLLPVVLVFERRIVEEPHALIAKRTIA